jgi:hypothetical protein
LRALDGEPIREATSEAAIAKVETQEGEFDEEGRSGREIRSVYSREACRVDESNKTNARCDAG